MGTKKYANNLSMVTSGDISASDTVIPVTDASAVPALAEVVSESAAVTSSYTGTFGAVAQSLNPNDSGAKVFVEAGGTLDTGTMNAVVSGGVGFFSMNGMPLTSADAWANVTGSANIPLPGSGDITATRHTYYANAQYIMFLDEGAGNVSVYTSPDGDAWTQVTAALVLTSYSGDFVGFSAGKLMYDGTNYVYSYGTHIHTSPDLITWTNKTVSSPVWGGDVLWNGATYLLLPSFGGYTYTSADLITWTTHAQTPLNFVNQGAVGGSTFYACAQDASFVSRVYTSTDGITWSLFYDPAPAGSVGQIIVYGTNVFIQNQSVVGGFYHSEDGGSTWATGTFPVNGTPVLMGTRILYGGVGTGTNLYTSTDNGVTYTAVGGLTFAAGSSLLYNLFVGGSSYASFYSTGVAGALHAGLYYLKLPGATGVPNILATDMSVVLVITTAGEVYSLVPTTLVATPLTATGLPTDGSITGCIHDGTNFIAYGTAGQVFSSPDGNVWTSMPASPFAEDILDMGVADGILVAAAGVNKVYSSSDGGVTWVDQALTGINASVVFVSDLAGVFVGGDDGAAGYSIRRSSTGLSGWSTITTLGGLGGVVGIAQDQGVSGNRTLHFYDAANREDYKHIKIDRDTITLTISDEAESVFEVVTASIVSGNRLLGVTRGVEGAARAWPSGSKVSHRLTAGLMDGVVLNTADTSVSSNIHIGMTSQVALNATPPAHTETITIGHDSDEGLALSIGHNISNGNNNSVSDTIAIGNNSKVGENRAMAIGVGAYAYGYDGFNRSCIAIGYKSYASSYGSTVLGSYATSSPYTGPRNRNVVVGSNAYGHNSAVAVGYKANTGRYAVSLGAVAHADGRSSVACGRLAYSTGVGAIALGAGAYGGGQGSVAIGYSVSASSNYAVSVGRSLANSKQGSMMVRALPIVRAAASVNTAPTHYDYAASEAVLMSELVDGLTIATTTITLPTGTKFFPNEIGVIITAVTGVITNLPTVSFGDSVDTAKLVAAAQLSGVAAVGDRQKFTALLTDAGQTSLTVDVSAVATGPTVFQFRVYFKGIFVED